MVGLVLKEIGLPTYFVSICSSQNMECLVSVGKEITHTKENCDKQIRQKKNTGDLSSLF
jgi:hypothetical protein